MLQLRIALIFILLAGAGGGYLYVSKLQKDTAILKTNAIKLESAVDDQKAVIEQQTQDFIITLPDSLPNLADEKFQTIKNSVVERIKEKPTSIVEQANKYFSMAFTYDGNFNRDEET